MLRMIKVLFVLLALPVLGGWIHGRLPDSVVDVYDQCLSTAQKTDVSNWGGTLNVTVAVNTCIALLPANGGTLFFGAGLYTVTCGSLATLSVPVTVIGEGSAELDAEFGLTQIECDSATASMFTVTKFAMFKDISLSNAHATPSSAGSAIIADLPVGLGRVDYDNVSVYGFFDGIYAKGGNDSWSMTRTHINNSANCSLKMENVKNSDQGDPTIANNWFYPGDGALAGVCYYSGGGGKFIGNKILPYVSDMQYGFYMDSGASVTGQLLFNSNIIERTSNSPIKVVKGWPYVAVNDNIIRAPNGAPAIDITTANNAIAQGNSLECDIGIKLTAVTLATIGPNQSNCNTELQLGAGVTDVNWISTLPTVVGSLPACASLRAGSRAYVTDANATTFHATVAGSGSNKLGLVCDGTNWKIGG